MSSIRISALDTWFFRESRPMDAIGGSELGSVFPPPPRTVLGALRSAIGDAQGVDWREFHEQKEQHPLYAHIGVGDDLGPLVLKGLWPQHNEKRLYPMPQMLLQKTEQHTQTFTRLRIGAGAKTHLGQVRLPQLPAGQQGHKPFTQTWITATGLNTLLAGGLPDAEQILSAKQLFKEEARLGIARDNRTRTVIEGNLYQTRHLRPCHTLSLEVEITQDETDVLATPLPTGLVRFGGEGRLAHLEPCKTPLFLSIPTPTSETRGLILILLSPAIFEHEHQPSWLPTGFSATTDEAGNTCWSGSINGVVLLIHAAILGKTQREGGWDLAEKKPRTVQSLIPAGSAYYVTLPGNPDSDNLPAAMKKLHGSQIGENTTLGRGLIACGLWNDNEY